MAEVFKRDGNWRVRVSYKDYQGKRRYKVKAGFRTKKDAVAYGNQLEVAQQKGGLVNRDVIFTEYFTSWYQTFREPGLSDRTKKRYQYTIAVIRKYFKNTMLRKITPTEYQRFLNWYGLGNDDVKNGLPKEKPHAKATVEKVNTHIRACVLNAMNDNIVESNFTLNTSIVYEPTQTKKIKWLNYSDAAKLYQYTLSQLGEINQMVPYMVLTSLLTGMRGQEVAGLTWQDVDFENGYIDINKTWDWDKHNFGPTKNASSMRKIKINRNLINILKKLQYEQNEFLAAHLDRNNPKKLIYIDNYDTVPEHKELNEKLRSLLKGAGIKQDLTFHGLRHTHASILLYQKMSIAYISHRLGHESITTTTKTYLHIIAELEQEEENRVTKAMDDLGNKNLPNINSVKA